MSNHLFIRLCEQQGLEVIPEYRFHPTRRWRVDYFFPPNLALEVEGGVWVQGRHNRASGFIKDLEKYNELSRMGIYLIRCLPDQLLDLEIMELIKDCRCEK